MKGFIFIRETDIYSILYVVLRMFETFIKYYLKQNMTVNVHIVTLLCYFLHELSVYILLNHVKSCYDEMKLKHVILPCLMIN